MSEISDSRTASSLILLGKLPASISYKFKIIVSTYVCLRLLMIRAHPFEFEIFSHTRRAIVPGTNTHPKACCCVDELAGAAMAAHRGSYNVHALLFTSALHLFTLPCPANIFSELNLCSLSFLLTHTSALCISSALRLCFARSRWRNPCNSASIGASLS